MSYLPDDYLSISIRGRRITLPQGTENQPGTLVGLMLVGVRGLLLKSAALPKAGAMAGRAAVDQGGKIQGRGRGGN